MLWNLISGGMIGGFIFLLACWVYATIHAIRHRNDAPDPNRLWLR